MFWFVGLEKRKVIQWAVWRGVFGCIGMKMHMVFSCILGMNDKEIAYHYKTTVTILLKKKKKSLSSIGNNDSMEMTLKTFKIKIKNLRNL
jgi:hypothetical protein